MRVYTVSFTAGTIATASGDYDLFELTPADDKPVAILGLTLANLSEVGDAQEEMLSLAIIRGHATSGSGGSSPTPAPLAPADTAAGFTAETLNTTIASTGTPITLAADGWNVRVPYQLFLPQEMWPVANQSNTLLVVRMLTTVADDITASGTLWVAELG